MIEPTPLPLTTDQEVGGSIPSGRASYTKGLHDFLAHQSTALKAGCSKTVTNQYRVPP